MKQLTTIEESLEDVLQAKMRQHGGLALDLTTRRDYVGRAGTAKSLAETVVYRVGKDSSGAAFTRRRYTGHSSALCAACGLHFADARCLTSCGPDEWEKGAVFEGPPGGLLYDAIANLEKGAREIVAYPRPA